MATVKIPVDPAGLFTTQTTTLDGAPYFLTFRYNSREACYYVTIQSSDQTVTYAEGIKLVPGIVLLQNFATPPGEMFVTVNSADDSPPRLGDIGDGLRCGLFYIEQADLIAAGAEPRRNPGPL